MPYPDFVQFNKLGTLGFEPKSDALEASILARLYYVPARIEVERWFIKVPFEGSLRFST